jgi:predicted nucleic acid-binding protein
MDATEVSLSVICVPEIISALNRLVREKSLPRRDYLVIKQRLSGEVRDVTIVNLVPEVIASSTRILETSALRALDALHVACALAWHAELFVSSDMQQVAAARKAGLRVKLV